MENLPLEIISIILSYLDMEDLLNARVVNRIMYEQTCAYPLNKRFQIVIKSLEKKLELYKLSPRHVRVESLEISTILSSFQDFRLLETLKFENSRVSIQELRIITKNTWKTIRTIEFTICKLILHSSDPNLENPQHIQFPNLCRLKILNCIVTDLFVYKALLQMSPNIKDIILRPQSLNRLILIYIYNKLTECRDRIELLDLSFRNYFYLDIVQLLQIKFTHLRTLKLQSDFRKQGLLKIWEQVGAFGLETLKLTYHPIGMRVVSPLVGGITMEFIRKYKDNVTLLKNLRLKNFVIDDEAMEAITNVPNLKQMDFKLCKFDGIIWNHVKMNKNMRVLKIQMCKLNHYMYNYPQILTLMWPYITYLDISGSAIKNEHFKYICLNWTQLVALNIDRCSGLFETDFVRQHENQIRFDNLSNLKYLSLDQTGFSDRICDHIRFPNLRVLHLFPNITIDGLRILGENNPLLEVVCPGIYHMIEIEPETFHIRDYFPNCHRLKCQCSEYFRRYLASI